MTSNVGIPRSSVLYQAMEIAKRAQISPRIVRRKLTVLGYVAVASVALGGLGLWLTASDAASSDERAAILGASVVLAAAVLFCTAVVSMVPVLWTAYAYQYVRSIEIAGELEVQVAHTEAVVQAVRNLGVKPSFTTGVVEIVAREAQEAGVTTMKLGDARLTKIAGAISVHTQLSDLIIEGLSTQPEAAEVLKALETN